MSWAALEANPQPATAQAKILIRIAVARMRTTRLDPDGIVRTAQNRVHILRNLRLPVLRLRRLRRNAGPGSPGYESQSSNKVCELAGQLIFIECPKINASKVSARL